MVKATKNKKKKNEEGRRVGHDFYDLLIKALVDPNGQGFECYRLLTTTDSQLPVCPLLILGIMLPFSCPS